MKNGPTGPRCPKKGRRNGKTAKLNPILGPIFPFRRPSSAHFGPVGPFSIFFPSAPAEGQQLQPKQTSDATSLLRLCCRTSVCHSGKGALDVASRIPRDEDVVALLRVPIPIFVGCLRWAGFHSVNTYSHCKFSRNLKVFFVEYQRNTIFDNGRVFVQILCLPLEPLFEINPGILRAETKG